MNFAKFLRTSFCRAPASAFLIYEGAKKEKYVTCWSKLELKGFGANTQQILLHSRKLSNVMKLCFSTVINYF